MAKKPEPRRTMQMRDPVCGMKVDPGTAMYRATYLGKEYLFCSEDCRRKFQENPSQYVARPA